MWLQRLILLCTFVFSTNARFLDVKDLDVGKVADAIETWAVNEKETELFEEAIETLRFPTELQRSDWRTFSGIREVAMCTICRSIAKTFIALHRKGVEDGFIEEKVTKLCTLLNIQTEEVCRGSVYMHAPTMLYILDQRPNLTEETVCGVLLESKHCPVRDPEYEWTINIDDNPTEIVPEDESRDPMKIVQITDLHYDPKYEAYGNANCKEPTCCRKGQNSTNDNTAVAGYWGDYNYCDTPWHAIVDVLDHVRDTHQNIDYLYFTGDIIDHGVWETSRPGNVESLNESYTQIYETFKGVPVYPTLGNHEPHPLNLFAPSDIVREDLTTNWLYELMADTWIGFGWIPESTRSTIVQGGFYTVSPKKGFRIIVLNNNVCYCYNWWIWYQPRDQDNQLQWLADTLLEAEQNREFVHILSHIPAGHKDCLGVWRREYLKIVSRFSHIISGQFNGHTHKDELEIQYNEEDVAHSVAWNGGSTTAYANVNPNYKVYAIDGSNFAVIDYDNWMYNLTEANQNADVRPRWYKSYSFKEEYGLEETTVKAISDWAIRAARDDATLTTYHRNFFKHAEPSLKEICNRRCKRQYVCRMITSSNKLEKEDLCRKLLRY